MKPLALVLLAASVHGQTLRGVVDIHVHCDPDSVPRSVDAVDVALRAKQHGIRSILLKNHDEPTASLAYLVRKAVPDVEAIGGIALNRTVGGINPSAVERMAKVKGGYGRVVWMPTRDAGVVAVSRDGRLLPEVIEVLGIIARHGMTLATGHSSPAENLMLIREARRAGVERIVVTHPLHPAINMSAAQIREAAGLGAYLEFVYYGLIGEGQTVPLARVTEAIRAAGPEHAILASDLGQAGSPAHAEGMLEFFKLLRGEGFSAAEIELMSKKNPAALLGLR